ncbi:hypothetical protein CEE37_12135 [candidate division LCP-89 bacterium B3_LCP]|uniref:Cytochrome C n=1 Tax=candidate division LCP-89 bacterium B3_LCP TaxID=2012998 RepID=A0A532UU90_UNCL8|nr:MAG: hypothetical protein CEE37_12135 [candidate division LCP-89 bacterium B3_LCP]
MNLQEILGKNASIAAVVIIVLLILLPLVWSIVSSVSTEGDQSSQLFLERPDPKYKNCIKDTEYMRYHHWELLRGIREEVVRYGKREDINFNKCRECHTSRERFCNKCHDATSLTPDCFDCHYYP